MIFPEEIKSIVSLEKAEKVVKEPKKPINNKGLIYVLILDLTN